MSKAPTIPGVRAKLKRAAAEAGLFLELSHSLRGWGSGVKVEGCHPWEAERAGLRHVSELGGLSVWLRSVLTHEELVSVPVMLVVSNSEPQVDYFDEAWLRVLPDWDTHVDLGAVSVRWARQHLGNDDEGGWTYDRGSFAHLSAEVERLAPSPAHLDALALCVVLQHETRRTFTYSSAVVNRLVTLDDTARALFQAMAPDWTGDSSELLDAVEALCPQPEAPTPVDPAPAAPTTVPDGLAEYFTRLLHEPKRVFAKAVWYSIAHGEALPESDAAWSADVVRKVRRYAAA